VLGLSRNGETSGESQRQVHLVRQISNLRWDDDGTPFDDRDITIDLEV